MNENAKKWVEALRSGEYSQFVGALHSPDGFCCLGVACDISGFGRWEETEHRNNTVYQYIINGDGQASHLPDEVVDWLGLRDSHGRTTVSDSLAVMNDKGVSFDEIAEMIESEPEGLFP